MLYVPAVITDPLWCYDDITALNVSLEYRYFNSFKPEFPISSSINTSRELRQHEDDLKWVANKKYIIINITVPC